MWYVMISKSFIVSPIRVGGIDTRVEIWTICFVTPVDSLQKGIIDKLDWVNDETTVQTKQDSSLA